MTSIVTFQVKSVKSVKSAEDVVEGSGDSGEIVEGSGADENTKEKSEKDDKSRKSSEKKDGNQGRGKQNSELDNRIEVKVPMLEEVETRYVDEDRW